MERRYPLMILVTLVVILGSTYYGYMAFKPSGLPFVIRLVDARTAVVAPIAGIPLPPGLQAGDRLDLPASDRSARIALLPDNLSQAELSAARTYDYPLRKHSAIVRVPVTSVYLSSAHGAHLFSWVGVFNLVLYASIALLLLWCGRGRASANMTLWAMAVWVGSCLNEIAGTGNALLAIQLVTTVCFLLARVGFYFTIESMLGTVLTPDRRRLFRAIFLLMLLASAVQQLGGVLMFVTTGWAELLQPIYGLVFSASYIVPVVMLFMSYGIADAAQSLHLRWILWSSVIWVAGIILSNTRPGFWASGITIRFMFVIAMAGFLYAVLRHRVVDISVVLDRTLVYGGMTALVVGILAAVNSLVEHAALGTNASLLLQVIVPLSLGIVLGRVRTYANRIVEQVFFRRKYLAEKALRRFVRHCGRYEQADQLFKTSIMEIRRHLGARGCAIFERKGTSYNCVYQEGEVAFPESAGIDDPAFVAARSEQKETDLSDIQSALGTDGYVFPMTALNELQGVLVCANRPREHYAADERKLLAQVARQMGGALLAINAREDRDFIRSVARGVLDPDSTRAQALRLETGWMEN